MIRPAAIFPIARPQRGAALIIAMILLLIMSLLAATSLRGTLMQERMSSNTYDRDLAFQSAEAGLRMGERRAENWVRAGSPLGLQSCNSPHPATGFYRSIGADTTSCPQPLWEGPAPDAVGSFWHDAEGDKGSNDIQFGDEKLSLAPYYIVELISENAPCQIDNPNTTTTCKRFRVTASSRAANGRARVILQSIYATDSGGIPPVSPPVSPPVPPP
ncbi:MAG: hypothetical protein LBP99_04745 [Azoarcus sp.]|jgi:type IV pilus assembly protein PilX|nr:hypothetical protein [Azoarcus sp.]